MSKSNNQNGITLVALIITIIVLLILAVTTINELQGDGIIAKAVEASFKTEITQVKEKITLKALEYKIMDTSILGQFTTVTMEDAQEWDADLKKEIIYWGQYDIGVTEITKEYAKQNWEKILENDGVLDNLYYVPKQLVGGKEKTYLYDVKEDIVFKIPVTKVGVYKVHSIEELEDLRGIVTEELITEQSQMITVDEVSHYEPDLSGFALEKTSIVYYDETVTNSIIISAQEYIENGNQRVIEKDGKKYEFYNYNSQKWANILIENNGMKSYWVWIPRYIYKEGDISDIKFIDLESELENGYILHSAFEDGKKGIWVSKYEPIQTANTVVEYFPSYLPDLEGFDKNSTYIEVYDSETQSFKETKLSSINNIKDFAKNNNWFDYNKQIWANIKVVNPETKVESWWVWIPRYAYNITGTNISIKFIDLDNNPLDGSVLPSNYIVHSAFEDDKKGIWASKYEPVLEPTKVGTSKVNEPDMSGFNVDSTYIECYDVSTNTFKEQTLRSILSTESVINSSNIVETSVIDSSKIKGTWYSYDKQIWANIKVVDSESGSESWWVWIPRYAYNITGIETSIIFLDVNGNPIEGGELPSNYIPHSVFEDGQKGIWASKYEPIQK